ncbi:uncharacterized protein GIQ15_02130 [Arthroderma uncinatum]|uniref:uncharacterized protein n=1 Tax=Arthroderma uncinatum TaxID=74035 RepID=UPI00144AE07E|nr:uncharacterized protein GIQ15_02130 [Arthroderma uncinatum]KAF3482806.1 hypothetical protein GIQ15_02130 [Arthroderma uncinatum]
MHPMPIVTLGLLLELLIIGVAHGGEVTDGTVAAANPGDTCESFAKQWHISIETFKMLNPDATCPNLVWDDSYYISGTYQSDTDTTSSTSITLRNNISSPTSSSIATPSTTKPGHAKESDRSPQGSSGNRLRQPLAGLLRLRSHS